MKAKKVILRREDDFYDKDIKKYFEKYFVETKSSYAMFEFGDIFIVLEGGEVKGYLHVDMVPHEIYIYSVSGDVEVLLDYICSYNRPVISFSYSVHEHFYKKKFRKVYETHICTEYGVPVMLFHEGGNMYSVMRVREKGGLTDYMKVFDCAIEVDEEGRADIQGVELYESFYDDGPYCLGNSLPTTDKKVTFTYIGSDKEFLDNISTYKVGSYFVFD